MPSVPHLRRTPRPRLSRSTACLGVCVLLSIGATRYVRLNLSPSVPKGLYRLCAVPTPLSRGTLVVLHVPRVVRSWWPAWWMPLLKPVAAVAGDEVCVREHVLWIGERSYGQVYEVAQGKPLPQWEGCQVVPEGAVFLASPMPKSMDGRYWRMTPIVALTARAVPLLTWR